jgi:hypothetical protein
MPGSFKLHDSANDIDQPSLTPARQKPSDEDEGCRPAASQRGGPSVRRRCSAAAAQLEVPVEYRKAANQLSIEVPYDGASIVRMDDVAQLVQVLDVDGTAAEHVKLQLQYFERPHQKETVMVGVL